ncbi:Glycosyltransferase (GlcNAc) [Luteibacter sp. UNCMF331Sha3.1]|uniref:GlcNAc-transferase family protein n=1 Tax=Luteibacter sp. UNCMF331Sha3.1 TaxID=1502760 RepID=UPI0008B73C27|nr:GlcNAc-transferase family protein [Luteibacter sp. UNCMF331Sha3.1]SEM99920.1 Glycosyltransferase (GlcNAc) [Luteibacter sp. UNCMF331Sha3.1]
MDGQSDERIFVQIPAYRDPELIPTLVDLVQKARYPERLRAGVCWQHDEGERVDAFAAAGFRVSTDVHAGHLRHRLEKLGAVVWIYDYAMAESRGCGWARAIAQQAFSDEAYTLQLDSHHRFARHWDSDLIGMLEALRRRSRRPVLVAHPPAYEPGQAVPSRCDEGYQIDFVAFGGPGVIRTRSTPIAYPPGANAPIRARFFSGGFAFADGTFVRDVPADPDHYFNTEEITLAVRAYTHGYDLFHPHRHVVWHYYGRPDAPKVWDDQALALARGETVLDGARLGLRALSDVENAFGMHGDPVPVPWLGRRRSLADYERYAGISFARREATLQTLCRIEPSDDDFGLDRRSWEARLLPAPRIP